MSCVMFLPFVKFGQNVIWNGEKNTLQADEKGLSGMMWAGWRLKRARGPEIRAKNSEIIMTFADYVELLLLLCAFEVIFATFLRKMSKLFKTQSPPEHHKIRLSYLARWTTHFQTKTRLFHSEHQCFPVHLPIFGNNSWLSPRRTPEMRDTS